MAKPRVPWISQLGLRLTLAFVGVALAAILVGIALISATVATDVNALSHEQHFDLTNATASAAAAAYDRVGWRNADLTPVTELVTTAGASVLVTDMSGNPVGSSLGFGLQSRVGQIKMPVIVDRQHVGWVTVRFGDKGLGAPVEQFLSERWRIRLGALGAAILIAVVTGLLVSRWITRPVETLISAVRNRGAGDQDARAGDTRGFGEIQELAAAFDQMAETLDQQERVRRNLVADVTHELRTPIAVLQAGHEAMLDGVAEPSSENLASLRDEVMRLTRMVEDLQRLASAEAAAMQLRLGPHDLASTVASAADSVASSFDSAGVSLERQLAEVTVMCDPLRIHEIVMNLLTNAVKFTPRGGRVVVETRPDRDHGHARALLRVGDTGIGIAAEDLARVSERFFRGQRSAGIAGSGIGMTIVSELVRAHHGSIEIDSEPDCGTTVTITFPVAGRPPATDGHRRHGPAA
jgi:two-component system, OmpR family, sensor histidine kinase BaeS